MSATRLPFFAAFTIASAAGVSACSLLYSSYDDRFRQANLETSDASVPFLVEDASIGQIAVASSAVYLAVGDSLVRVEEESGVATPWWTGDSGAAIVALASNGSDHLAWTDGADITVKNRVFVAPSNSPENAVEVDNGSGVGLSVAVADDSAWTAAVGPNTCTSCQLASVRSNSGGATISLSVAEDAGHTGITTRAVSVDSNGVDVLANPAHFVRFGFDGSVKCSSFGFTPSIAALATSPDGTTTFVLSGASATSGTLVRFDDVCPALDGGTTVASGATLVVTDASAVYWSTADGKLMRAGFKDAVGEPVAIVPSAPTSIAVSATYLYAAVGTHVLRFPKNPQ